MKCVIPLIEVNNRLMEKRGTTEAQRKGGVPNQTVYFKNKPCILGGFSIVGPKEGKGLLGETFSHVMDDDYFGEKTHEQAEQKMFEHAIRGATEAAGLLPDDVDMILAGDLLNQIISATFAARSFDTPFVGLYGACSTMALSLATGAVMVDGGYRNNVVVAAGSHFATAERQYRTPLELGNLRHPASQWTVTGVGATALGTNRPGQPIITAVTFGKVCDWGVLDVNNMGAAMAPAAAETLVAHFRDTGTTPEDFDAIFTGDLGQLGEQALRDLMANQNYALDSRYTDCGRMIFASTQNQYMGGSGCGCSAVCLNGFILNKLHEGKLKKILFVATGALLSPVSSFQGNTIPSVAHCVRIEV